MPNVNIEVSILLSTQDFKIVGDVEYDKFGDGMCVEGHRIKYGIEIVDEDNNIYVFGNQCVAKPFILKQWKLKPEMLDNPDVMKAGRYLWIIARDGLDDYVGEIPHPEDLDWDFEELKKRLKTIVFGAKRTKKVEIKKMMKQEKMKRRMRQFKTVNTKQCELVNKLIIKIKRLKENNMVGILNSFYKEFIVSVIGNHQELKILSEKQMTIIEKIIVLKEEAEVKGSLNDKITKVINLVDILGDWDKKFIFSLQSQYYEKGTLSEKQKNKLDEILERNEQFKEYIGGKMTTWITEQKVGISGVHGIVKYVKAMAKSGKAVLVVYEVEEKLYENWIPISHIK